MDDHMDASIRTYIREIPLTVVKILLAVWGFDKTLELLHQAVRDSQEVKGET